MKICIRPFVRGVIFFTLIAGLTLPARASMLVRYTFDEASSGTTNALNVGGSLGASANGVFNGNATRTSNTPDGYSLGALSVTQDGSNGTWVGPTTDVGLGNLGTAMTISTWINVHANNTANPSWSIIASDSSTGAGWRLIYFGTPGALEPSLEINQSTEADTTVSVNAADTWVFLAASWSGNTVNYYTGTPGGTLSLLQSVVGFHPTPNPTMNNAAVPMRVGGNFSGGAERTPTALLDDFRVYNTALNESELQAVMLEDIPEPASLGLLAAGGLLLFKRRR